MFHEGFLLSGEKGLGDFVTLTYTSVNGGVAVELVCVNRSNGSSERSSHLCINARLCTVVIVDTCAVDAIPPEDGNQESFCAKEAVFGVRVIVELTLSQFFA